MRLDNTDKITLDLQEFKVNTFALTEIGFDLYELVLYTKNQGFIKLLYINKEELRKLVDTLQFSAYNL